MSNAVYHSIEPFAVSSGGCLYENIARHGAYYNPAWKHYGRHTNVVCDKCRKSNLNVCIGYMQSDLCLTCAGNITTHGCCGGGCVSYPDTVAYAH
mgnify:CR=1 FL=1